MSGLDTLGKRLDKLLAGTDDSALEAEWQGLVAGSKDRLIAKIERIRENTPPEDMPSEMSPAECFQFTEELKAHLTRKAAEEKAEWMQFRKSRRYRTV